MDPFATLGIERRFDVDLKETERKHRDLSRALHPDKYAAAGASERRTALTKAVEVNEAWRTVRDPVRRAEALFTLSGFAVGETHEPKPAPALLMDILEQREALAEARAAKDPARVASLERDIDARMKDVEARLASAFGTAFAHAAGPADRDALAKLLPSLGELRFYRRFLDEVTVIEDEMVEAGHASDAESRAQRFRQRLSGEGE